MKYSIVPPDPQRSEHDEDYVWHFFYSVVEAWFHVVDFVTQKLNVISDELLYGKVSVKFS